MKKPSLVACAAGALLVAAGSLLAQAPPGPPKPGPEHQKLTRFIGTWKGKGTMQPGPMGPGGAMTWTETCEWFQGNFHVVCKSDATSPMGANKAIGIIGYDEARKGYTWYGIDSMGFGDFATGSLQGKTWTFNSEFPMEGKTMKSQFLIEEVSDTSHKFTWKLSEDGKTWNTMMSGEASK